MITFFSVIRFSFGQILLALLSCGCTSDGTPFWALKRNTSSIEFKFFRNLLFELNPNLCFINLEFNPKLEYAQQLFSKY